MLVDKVYNSLDMLQMVEPSFTENQNIISVNNNEITEMWEEYILNGPHEGSRSIGKAEGITSRT